MKFEKPQLVLWFCVMALLPAPVQAGEPAACDLVSEKEAQALVGGPLGEVFRTEQKASVENGHDHLTVCGYFPAGYDIQKADEPPEQGLEIQLHNLRSNADAVSFYENAHAAYQEMSRAPDNPLEGGTISPLEGMGEGAFLLESKLDAAQGAPYEIANVYVVKGRMMVQITAWKRAAPAGEIATEAAQKVLARLP
jgi:hypothetical protein